MRTDPLGYLITFHTYGTWLHGDRRGSVDRHHNTYATDLVRPNESLRSVEQSELKPGAITLGPAQRSIVAEAIEAVVQHRGWTLHAISVRSNHVHLVVAADVTPERVLNTMKSWATRRLRDEGLIGSHEKTWTRNGSTRYLWKPQDILCACQYVAEGQGPDLA